MGFFDLKATCAICGKEVGLNRFKIGKTTSGKDIWKCPVCKKKGGLLNIDYVTGKVTFIDNRDTETRMKCNVCGHIYCYTFEDLQRNEKLAKSAVADSLLGVGEALGGTRLGSQVASTSAPAISAADELKKFKELLDSGIITQEEFDAKRKQLLGL